MTKKTNDALSRSDRVLIAALAIILATASAAVGASLTNHAAAAQIAMAKSVSIKIAPPPVEAKLPGPDAAMTQLLAEHRCLSEVLYYEARGEGDKGQKAVAEVVFHRMNTGNYGHSICAVVYEGAGHPGCQFSFTCNGDLVRHKEAQAWTESERLAAEILSDQAWRKDSTGGATNYHAASVSPDWAPTLEKTGQIGNHVFYRGGAAHSRDS
jgi:spore germination cell wall hydrolase CwlJ-like protein